MLLQQRDIEYKLYTLRQPTVRALVYVYTGIYEYSYFVRHFQ